MKKKKNIIMILFLIVSVGFTLAYFTSTSSLENEFKSGKYKTVSEEEFVSPTNWTPGQTIPKSIITTNEGTLPVRVRVKFEESWTSANGDDLNLNLDYNHGSVSIINFDNNEDWVYRDEYFYYANNLGPGESTSSLISGVTLNSNTPSSIDCTNNNGVYTCESTGDGYDDATYKLKIITETVQSDAILSAWGLDFDPTLYYYTYVYSPSNNDIEVDNFEDVSSNIFIKNYKRNDNIITSSIGFYYNDSYHYLKSGSNLYENEALYYGANYEDSILYYNFEEYYNENKAVLQEVFDSSICEETIYDEDEEYSCSVPRSDIYFTINNNGLVKGRIGCNEFDIGERNIVSYSYKCAGTNPPVSDS